MLLCLRYDTRLAEAEAEFRVRHKASRHTQCRLLEIRAATSYFRLRRRLGDVAGGRVVLADVAGWFTEGVNSPSMTAARMLLGNQDGST